MKPVKIPAVLKSLAKMAVAPILKNDSIGGEFSSSFQDLRRSVNELRGLADKIEAFLKDADKK